MCALRYNSIGFEGKKEMSQSSPPTNKMSLPGFTLLFVLHMLASKVLRMRKGLYYNINECMINVLTLKTKMNLPRSNESWGVGLISLLQARAHSTMAHPRMLSLSLGQYSFCSGCRIRLKPHGV